MMLYHCGASKATTGCTLCVVYVVVCMHACDPISLQAFDVLIPQVPTGSCQLLARSLCSKLLCVALAAGCALCVQELMWQWASHVVQKIFSRSVTVLSTIQSDHIRIHTIVPSASSFF